MADHIRCNSAAPSVTASPPTPATKSSTPALPPELVADIIDLTVEVLIAEERDLPSQTPITNHFLLSAMLVDRVWHSIAVSALLKHGLVTPSKVDSFLAQIKEHRIEETLESVRFGLGNAGLDEARDGSEDDTKFSVLITSLPGLKALEVIGRGGLISAEGFTPNLHAFDQIRLSNAGSFGRAVAQKFSLNIPAALVISETRMEPRQEALETPRFARFMYCVPSISIHSNQLDAFTYLANLTELGMGHWIGFRNTQGQQVFPTPFAITSYHFDCTDAIFTEVLIKKTVRHFTKIYQHNLQYPNLGHLAAHLEILHYLATAGSRPSLTSLNVLAYPESVKNQGLVASVQEAEFLLLDLVQLPVLAKLRVPSLWRSEAVEVACEAKGIDLRWT